MMTTCLGAAGHLDDADVKPSFGLGAAAFLMEGYMLALKSDAPLRIYRERALSGVTTALSLSAAWIVKQHSQYMREALRHSSVVFANAEEAEALTGRPDPAENCRQLCAMIRPSPSQTKSTHQPIAVVTSGEHGAYVCRLSGSGAAEPTHIPAVPTKVKDVTGAGDAFAGAFLFLLLNGADPIHAARGAAALASQVVSEIGARVSPESAKIWANDWLARVHSC
jgi:sugar/nucleoside kinase (ribokinase family)